MEDLALDLKIRFFQFELSQTKVPVDGMASISDTAVENNIKSQQREPGDKANSIIILYTHLLWSPKHLHRKKCQPEEIELFELRIAITLIHELAHVV
jgi:hypothetical protein